MNRDVFFYYFLLLFLLEDSFIYYSWNRKPARKESVQVGLIVPRFNNEIFYFT